jgi:hypothetical protein
MIIMLQVEQRVWEIKIEIVILQRAQVLKFKLWYLTI